MAHPINWLFFEAGVLAVVGVIALFVARAAVKQNKRYGIEGQ
jgi:hypothetical protein